MAAACVLPVHLTLLTRLRARVANLRVLNVSCRQASEGLTLATMIVLALPPIESCKAATAATSIRDGNHFAWLPAAKFLIAAESS
jgi:hypothetical protein